MVAFRNDEYLWWQVAEYGFDAFMIRMRARLYAEGTRPNRGRPPGRPRCFGRAAGAAPYNFRRTSADWI